jgi:hypothetical protein
MLDVFGGRWDVRLAALCSLVFLFVASIPGTIALRYMLQAILLVLVIIFQRDTLARLWSESRWPTIWLGAFVGFGALHCALIAFWPGYAWQEFRSQLIVGLLWFVIGWGVFRRPGNVSILDQVIIAGSGLSLAEFLIEAWHWHHDGVWPFMVTFMTDTHLEFTLFANMVLACIGVALIFRRACYVPHSRLPAWLLAVLCVLIVFVSLRVAARNGMLGLLALLGQLTVLGLWFETKRVGVKRILAVGVLALAAIGVLGGYAFKQDARNQVLIGSLNAGWNYQQSDQWLDSSAPLPTLPDGRQADESAYRRLAWFHRGLRLIVGHPMGFGYGRDAFGLALLHEGYKTYPSTNAHSGVIDLGIRLGVPGILLWTAYCLSLVVIGYRAFTARGDLRGLVLLLLSCGHMARMMIESIQRDHMLYLFLFISAGLLAEISARRVPLPD